MPKNKNRDRDGDDGERRIIIRTGEEPIEPNSTLIDLLVDGERPKPGEPGMLAHRLGHEVQAFMAEQVRVATHGRTAATGTVTITMQFVTGMDGSNNYAVDIKTKAAKIPPRTTVTFVNEDGELTGRPVEPLTEEMNRRERASKIATPSADPKAGAASTL